MQIEGRKMIVLMNFSVLDFFRFVSRMPQIAQILVSTFKISPGPPSVFPLLFSVVIPGSVFVHALSFCISHAPPR